MEQNTVGTVLHYYRKKYKLSAAQICGGICSPSNFYLLEDGVREMDSLICQMLLSRVGKEVNQFEIMLDEVDYQQWKLRYEITQCLGRELTKLDKQLQLEELLIQYKKIMPRNQKVHRQFCLLCEIKMLEQKNVSTQLLLRKTIEALLCTREYAKDALYSQQELELICCRSRYLASEDFYFARQNLRHMLQYVKLFSKGRMRESFEVPIYETLIELCMENRRWREAVCYLDETIQIYQETTHLFQLGGLYRKKAICLKNQGCCFGKQNEKEVRECEKIAQTILDVFEEKKETDTVCRGEGEACPTIVPAISFGCPEPSAI